MADVRPFRGLTYNLKRVSIEKVVTQPYDKISSEMRDRYYAADPHNVVRVILGKSHEGDSAQNDVYTRAASTLQEWRASGVLEPMRSEGFLVYFQRFTVPGTREERVRKGFIGLGRLEDYANKVVFPHERTLAGPKQDRLQLLRHTQTHFEQIFMLYEDEQQQIDRLLDATASGRPFIEATDEYSVSHTLWTLDAPGMTERIQSEMMPRRLIIADGHHRYETALAYRNEKRAAGFAEGSHDWLPMTFFNMSSPALTVLPTHRVIAGLSDFNSARFLDRASEFFEIDEAPLDPALLGSMLREKGRLRTTFGMVTDGGQGSSLMGLKSVDLSRMMEGLSEKQRTLDVVVLHRLLLLKCLGITDEAVEHESHITYFRGIDEAIMAVRGGNAQIAFLLNPVRLDQMRDIVYEGNVMPQKSTDFYPKVLSGLVLYPLNG